MKEAIQVDFINDLWNFGDSSFTPMHGSLPDPDYSFRYFAIEGSKFSLSKVNILIGYIFLFVWICTVIINPLIVDSSLLCALISSAASFFIMFIIFPVFFCLSASDGYRSMRVINTIRRNKKARRNYPGDLKFRYIIWLLKSSEALEVKRTRGHVNEIFQTYKNICGHRHTLILITKFLGYLDNKSKSSNIVEVFENDSFLKNMLEIAIMYRTMVPDRYIGKWSDADGRIVASIESGRVLLIIREETGIMERIDLSVVSSNVNRSYNNAHLFADNMWARIGSIDNYADDNSRIERFETLFSNPSAIHLLSEKSNGDRIYIKLSFHDSLLAEMTGGNDDQMNIVVCNIDTSGKLSWKDYRLFRTEK